MIKRFILLLLVGLCACIVQAQTGNPHIINYLPGTYKALPVNWYVAEDGKGIMYFANRGNLLQFDGANWKKITIQHYSPIRSVATADDGIVYVGTTNDFGYLAPDSLSQFRYHSFKPHLDSLNYPAGSVWKIFPNGNKVYFQTKARLYRWDGQEFKVWHSESGFHRAFMANNKLWIKDNSKGLLYLEDDSLRQVPQGEILAQKRIYVLLPFRDQSVVIFTDDGETYVYNEKARQLTSFQTSADEYLKNHKAYHGIQLYDGTLAIATLQGGVVLLNKNAADHEVITKKEGLPDNDIKNLYQSRDGSLWCATANGISVIKINQPVRVWDERKGIESAVHAILRNPHDSLVYLATSKGVCFLKDNEAHYISGINDQVWDLAFYDDQLLATSTAGIYGINGDHAALVVPMTVPFKMKPSIRHAMLFVGTVRGFYGIQKINGNWTVEHIDLEDRVLDILEDSIGQIWVSTGESGVFKYQIENSDIVSIKAFSATTGYPFTREVNIFSLGKELFFNADKILYKTVSDDHFVPYAEFGKEYVHGDSGVFHLSRDGQSNTWIYGASTDYDFWIEMIPGQETYDKFGKIRRPFRFIPPMSIFEIYHERESSWIAGSDGAFQYFHEGFEANGPPEVNIRKVENGQTGHLYFGGDDQSKEIKINYQDPVAINYASPVYGELHPVSYRYRLKGYSVDWSHWSTDRKATFAHLAPGEYVFEVQSNLGDKPSAFSFIVGRPWYLSYWFYGVCLLFALAGVWFVSYLYAIRLRHQNEKLEHIVAERTSELLVQKQKVEEQKTRIEHQKADIEEKNGKLKLNNKALRKLNKEKNYLMGVVAHDLKNPLNTIYGLAELLNFSSDKLNPKQEEYLSSIKSIAFDLTERINKILNISAIEANSVIMNLKEEDLDPLVEEVVNNFKHQSIRNNINIELRSDSNPHFSVIDKSYFKQIMENLISNAIKYSSGNRKVNVNITAEKAKVRIEVVDQGPGISPQEMKQLFRPFRKGTAVPSGNEKATGMGLSIVKRYIEALDGRVYCKSQKGKGSIFVVELDRILYEQEV